MSHTRSPHTDAAIIALGANLVHDGDSPAETLEAALRALAEAGLASLARSRFYCTPAWPPGAGPDFVNAAALLSTGGRRPEAVIAALHAVEARLGRERRARWAPRTCDLDLLAMGDTVLPDRATAAAWMALDAEGAARRAPDRLVLPHPRLQERAFVLVPMADVAPDWRHPLTGLTVRAMLEALPAAARAEAVALD